MRLLALAALAVAGRASPTPAAEPDLPPAALRAGEHFRERLSKHYRRTSDQLDLPIDWNAGARFARIGAAVGEPAQRPKTVRTASTSDCAPGVFTT